jgi:phage gp36-like protein
MGNYCAQADLLVAIPRNELIQLTDVDDDGSVNSATVTAAIGEAEADLDAYISRRRDVPVSPVPDKLKYLAVRWTLYVLHRYRRSVTEDMETDHKRDVDWLTAYAEGDGSLGDDDDPHSPGVGSAKQDSPDRVWTRGELPGW